MYLNWGRMLFKWSSFLLYFVYSFNRNVLTRILINMLESPVDETINPEEDLIIDVENMPGYEGTFNKLIYANKIEHDPVKGGFNSHFKLTCLFNFRN